MSIRILIADDHPIVRDGLRFSIERSDKSIQIVAESATGMEVLRKSETTEIDVYILDITMPELNGIETAIELLRRKPEARIIILSFHNSRAMIEKAMATGAKGYLTKETATQTVVEAVRQVHSGKVFLSPEIANLAPAAVTKQCLRISSAAEEKLTHQERRILQLIAEGFSTKEIAAKLERSPNTVHVHRNRIMAKLAIHKYTDLVRYALREGIAKP
jgi:DNA-binding NarL/FixJ family response regulator